MKNYSLKQYKTNKQSTFERNTNTYTLRVCCEWKKTSYGFKHEATATLYLKNEKGTTCYNSFNKACYYNRTWENYTFQSVILGAMNKMFKGIKDNKIVSDIKRITKKFDNDIKEHKYNSRYIGA